MKKIISLLIAILVGLAAFLYVQNSHTSLEDLLSYSKCDQPIHYRVDSIDSRFNLSKETFVRDIKQAAEIWNKQSLSTNKAEKKELFVYSPEDPEALSINMVYDARQRLNSQINQLETKLKGGEGTLKTSIADYNRQASDFKARVEKLNEEIKYWNSQGGAPPEVYERLKKEQQDLQGEADRLNTLSSSLSQSTQSYNTEVNKLNQTIGTFNAALEEKPEEGLYKGPENRIDIYFNINSEELIHTLAHELGHALGIEHINNKKAIMYPFATRYLQATPEDLKAIQEVCKKRKYLEEFFLRLQTNLQLLTSSVK